MQLTITDIKPKIEDKSITDKNLEDRPRIIKIRDYLLEYYEFRYNTVLCKNEYKKMSSDDYIQLDERTYTDLVIELKTLKFQKPKEDLDDILKSSIIDDYNPISSYFDGLEYKGTGFIDKLADCITLENLEFDLQNEYKYYLRYYLKQWLIACYFCSIGKSVNDVMFILIGGQGKFKTSFLNYLTPKELVNYRVTNHIIPSLTDYNTASFLVEKMFINVDDQMETIFGKDYNSMKAIISAVDVNMRRKYGKMHERRLRIANFCGSVNNPQFLRDSNNRRYLCFSIVEIDKSYSKIDINDVWAEVVFEAKKLNSYYIFGRSDYETMEQLNKHFSSPVIEEEALISIFMPTIEENENTYYLQFAEIMKMIRYQTGDNSLKTFNLQTAMRKHGFTNKSKKLSRFNGSPRYVYQVQLISNDSVIKSLIEPYKIDSQKQIF